LISILGLDGAFGIEVMDRMAASSQLAAKDFFVAIKRSCFLAGKGILGGKTKGGAPNAFATWNCSPYYD